MLGVRREHHQLSAARPALRIANFSDSCLEALERKGNLATAPALYNPGGVAERVLHFSPCAEDVRFGETFRDARVEIVPLFRRPGDRRRLNAYPGALWRLYRALKRERVNLIRGRLPFVASLMGILAGRALGLPSVVSLGGDNRIGQERSGRFHLGSRRLTYGLEWLVLRLSDVIIAPNRFTAEYVAGIIGERRARARTRIVPWRVEDPPADGPGPPEGAVDDRRPALLVAGALNPYKYTDVLFDLADRLAAWPEPRPQMVFCGAGPLEEEGRRRFGGSRDVRLLGWQPQSAVRSLMRRASAVLVPMSGFVLLEAAAEARPVIASRVEWHSELVEDGVNGLLVDPLSAADWEAGVRRLLGDPDEAGRFGEALRAAYLESWSPRRAEAGEIEVLESLLARRAGHGHP